MGEEDLLFIKNVALRRKIEQAIAASVFFRLQAQAAGSPEFTKEMFRISLLYIAAIIEAMLLYVYKDCNFSDTEREYKFPHAIPQEFQHDKRGKIVIAIEVDTKRHERALHLGFLATYIQKERVISTQITERIRRVNDIRNTFHLSKSRQGMRCTSQSVEEATKTLTDTISSIRAYLDSKQRKTALREEGRPRM